MERPEKPLNPSKPPFVRNGRDKALGRPFGLGHAFSCAAHGIAHAFKTQRNMVIHGVVAAMVAVAALGLNVPPSQCALLVVCIVLVLAAEIFNTALEAAVDLVTESYAELARIAKDCAAGAVLVCAAGSVLVGALVFVPAIARLLE